MSRYKIAEMMVRLYLIGWGAVLTVMGIYGYAVEGANGATIELVDQYVGPIGTSICCLVVAISATVMTSEAQRGRCS